jgi:flavin-dependent dehydrogenase
MSSPLVLDVAVVGGGPAGAVVAQTVARRGARAVVLERRAGPAWQIGETLPPAARPLLRRLGALDAFEAAGHLPSYGNQSAWGSAHLAATDFIFNPNGHGWQLDRVRFEAQLARGVEESGGHYWYGAGLVAGPRYAGGRWELAVRGAGGDRVLSVRCLVDATGRRAALARRLGARRGAVDSLACVYALALPGGARADPDTRTLIEAAPDGWWYTAATPGGRRTVAWLSDPDLLRQQGPWTAEAFRSRVEATRHIHGALDRCGYHFTGPPRCTSARSARLEPWSGPGWLAVGDAAMSLDPLSSQGLLNALSTGLRAGHALADWLAGRGEELRDYVAGLEETWAAYLRNRAAYYRAERRWPASPFWGRRR